MGSAIDKYLSEYGAVDLGLSGQCIIVTGGSSGIGFETARVLLSEGALVTICGRDPRRLASAEAALGSQRLRAVPADVLDAGQAKAVVWAALEHGGRLDGVAAIAGGGRHGTLLDLDPTDTASEVSNKLLGLLNIVKPAVPSLTDTSGRIVGLTAPTAARPDPLMGAVSVGRAALGNAMSSLASELAPRGIRVNAVGVGLIDTPRQQARHAASSSNLDYCEWLAEEAHRRSIPLGRSGTSNEVAAAVCWLLSPISSYTTGAIIDVTGGLESR